MVRASVLALSLASATATNAGAAVLEAAAPGSGVDESVARSPVEVNSAATSSAPEASPSMDAAVAAPTAAEGPIPARTETPGGPASRGAPVPAPTPTPTPTRPEDPFDVDLAIDLPIIALTGSVFLGTELIKSNSSWQGCLACDPSRLGPIDRRVVDNWSPGAATASDVLLATAIGGPLVADLADVLSQRTGIRGFGKDAVILVEVFMTNGAVTNAVKYAVGRPRPYTYGLDGSGRDPTAADARLSFYSGHASTAFAMASAYGSIFQARHPRSKWVAPVWVTSYAIAASTAVLRVAAGKHFWSDVLVGAIAGTGIGLLLPAAHRLGRARPQRRQARIRVDTLGLAPTLAGSMAALRGRF